MTFDEAFKAEAEHLFETMATLERSTDGGKVWELLEWGPIAAAAYMDKSLACALASPRGAQLTDGSSVRFIVPPT